MSEPLPDLPPHANSNRLPFVLLGVLMIGCVAFLKWQGRVWWCACGHAWPVILNVNSSHNSQHLFDPYVFSHVLHGVLFFGLAWIFADRFNLSWRFLLAAAVEIAWEMAENSPLVIDRYRNATVSLGYTGDSIVNSLGDIIGFAAGFFLARAIGLWASIAVGVVIELGMLWLIRDNLTLNVLMLIWPIDAVRKWQSGG